MSTKYPFHLPNLPAAEYHGRSEWSQSRLKVVLDNPEKLLWKENNEPVFSGSQSLGTLVHAATLEPESFADKFTVKPDDINRRGATNQAIYDKFFYDAKKRGQEVVSGSDYETALAIANKLQSHPEAAELLFGEGPMEISLFDEINGLPCRGRPDKFHAASRYLVDLKTTRDGKASPSAWPYQISEYRYDMQAVMYMSLWKRCFDVMPEGFKHVVIETEPPYSIAIYTLSRTWIEVGKKLLSLAIEAAKRCESTGIWPGYPVLDEPLEPPPWEVKRILGEEVNQNK